MGLALGCGSPPGALAPRETAAAEPSSITLPDLSLLEPQVRTQIQSQQARLTRTLADPEASPRDRAEAHGNLGLVLQAAGYTGPTEQALLRAHALAPTELRWAYYLAHFYRQAGDRGQAATYFERSLDLDPAHLPSLVWLGEMYLDEGRPGDALRTFDRVLEHQPDSAAAWSGLGRAALASEDAVAAVESLERALELEPAATSLHYNLGMAYSALGNVEQAERHMDLRGPGLPAVPDPLLQASAGLLRSTLAYESRGMLAMDEGRFSEAAAIFREGLQGAPDDPVLRHRLGAALMSAGDGAGAETQFEAVLDRAPDFAEAHFSLGLLSAQRGELASAIDRYATAVEHRPTYVEARVRLAEAYFMTGRREQAATELLRVVELDPSFTQAWLVRAVTLVELERYREARDWLDRALLAHPAHPDLTDLLARVLAAAPVAEVRDGARALALVQPRLEERPTIEMAETLAMVLAENGVYDEAVAWQRRAMDGARQTGQHGRIPFMARNLSLYEERRPSRTPLQRRDD